MQNVYKIIGFVIIALVALMLAGCGDGGGGTSSLRQRINGGQANTQPTPAPQVTTVVERETVRETVEVVREVSVEVLATVEVPVVQTVLVEVVTTPMPDVQGFAAPASDCNTYVALPVTVEPDGTISGTYLMCAWETAVAISEGK
jgi:hypothetical protein